MKIYIVPCDCKGTTHIVQITLPAIINLATIVHVYVGESMTLFYVKKGEVKCLRL